jgi:hypothetical protein
LQYKKEYAKSKLIERCGTDWRQSQFSYAISAINAFLYDISTFFESYRRIVERICFSLSILLTSNSLYSSEQEINLQSCKNYNELLEQETDNPRYIKQRSDKWMNIRKKAKVTGSTLYEALGLDTLKKQQQHFEKVICGIEEPHKFEEVQSFMEYGVKNEQNAIATLVSRILPTLLPNLEYFEEGCVCIEHNEKTFAVVSPDGSLQTMTDNGDFTEVYGVEIKCPVKRIHNSVPERYILQCLAEMEALNVDKLLYICWRPDFTAVFEIHHNRPFFKSAMKEALDKYGNEQPKRPTRLPDHVSEMRNQIKKESQKAKFLGEFPSVSCGNDIAAIQQGYLDVKELKLLLNDIIALIGNGYDLQRQKASEAVVFICSDLDRFWCKNRLDGHQLLGF